MRAAFLSALLKKRVAEGGVQCIGSSQGSSMTREQRFTFNEVGEQYDRYRPGYPESLFEDLLSLSGISPGEWPGYPLHSLDEKPYRAGTC